MAAGVGHGITGATGRVRGGAANRPLPCVTATRLEPIQNSSSIETFAGPSPGTDHVLPPSWLVNRPTSVAAYSQEGRVAKTAMSRTGTAGSPVAPEPDASAQDVPPLVVFHTLPVLTPLKVQI